MEGLAVAYSDTTTANNATFQQPSPFDSREDNIRIDYRINGKHNVYGRYLHDMYDLIDPFGTFITSPLPTIPTNRLRPGSSYQVSWTWLISPTFINEAKVNAAWNGQRIPPVGEFWKRETFKFTYPQLFSGGRFDNGIPNTTFAGNGAPANFNGPSGSLLSPTTDIALSDNVTLIRGKHSLKTGFIYVRNRKDQTDDLVTPGRWHSIQTVLSRQGTHLLMRYSETSGPTAKPMTIRLGSSDSTRRKLSPPTVGR